MNKHFSFQPEQSVSNFKSFDMTREEKVAQIIVDSSVFQFHKNRLMNEIDQALGEGNRQKFKILSNEYNTLLEQFSHLQ
ncbi:IDEAL domain-containing protein [Sutcliffiella horikoshii]|uniref:IDEAL domain-containing protein n=1 Tax=Sutcliffiella horikoshii TaxID=79883 RepID=UPI001CFEC7FC|nr:IDEAL domain-containing protein [Sutcliffiella horikoshii]